MSSEGNQLHFGLRSLVNTKRLRSENRALLLCLPLFYIIWKVFYPCLGNDFVNYDDQEYVYENEHVKSGLTIHTVLWAFSTSTSGNWHPITMLSHILDWEMYGNNPWGHHLLNVILHCSNGVLAFLILLKTTFEIEKSFVAALLFSLHPLRVESVAWISERKDVLSTCFLMLTVLSYTGYLNQRSTNGEKVRFYYLLSVSFFVAGLMSKSMLVVLPCVLLLFDVLPL
jgi:protein O-mannosyl-transferase